MYGDEFVRFRFECSRSMYEQSTNILDQARFVTVCKTILIRLLYVSSTVCYSLVRLNTTFTQLTGHLQG